MPSLISISRDGSTFRFVCDVLILLGEAKYTFDGNVKLGYTYKYDTMDRITEVRKSGSPNSQYLEYAYDKLGQLVSATDRAAGLEYTYTFDTAGNVLSAVTHPTDGGSDSARTYHYDNASWRDLLTSITIDGTTKEIKYPKDSSGNVKAGTPLSWYNGSEFTLTWGKGTQLASAKKGLALKTSYDYDIAGVRSSKTVGTTKYSFTTLSGLVMRQEWGARQMDFVYDENNQPYALSYKSGKNVTPVMYYYLLNQQGDVEALMDANGAIVATYEYDPWGAVTVKNASGALDNDDTSIGNMNPLRYRGYYYDNETGFYYLESRYYDPVVGRFISADTFATTDCNGFLSANMFAYCENNPVQYEDKDGTSATLAGAIVGGVIGAVDAWANGGTLEQIAGCALVGAAVGAAAGFVADATLASGGLAGGIFWGAFANGAGSVIDSALKQMIMKETIDLKQVDWGAALFSGGVGAAMGALCSATSAITKPIVKGIANGFKFARNQIVTELSNLMTRLSNMTIKIMKIDLGFSAATGFGGWLFNGLYKFFHPKK